MFTMEPFVTYIVTGGLTVLGGLWLLTLPDRSIPWAIGLALVVFGSIGLARGIWRELEI